jgi:hypothetical protein
MHTLRGVSNRKTRQCADHLATESWTERVLSGTAPSLEKQRLSGPMLPSS